MKRPCYRFEEYQVEIECIDPALLRLAGTRFRLPWLASFKNWGASFDECPGPGNGATKEEAVQRLRELFEVHADTHRSLPDPKVMSFADPQTTSVPYKGFEDLFELFVRLTRGNFVSIWPGENRTIAEVLQSGRTVDEAFRVIEEVWGILPEEAGPLKIRGFLKRILDAFPWYRTAFVGLFWYHNGAVPGNLYHLTNAYVFGRFLGPYRSHEGFWETIQPSLSNIGAMKADDLPRGRVLFDFRNRKFVIIADRLILSDPVAVAAIKEAFHLPEQIPVQFEEDPFYGPFPTSFPIAPTPADCFEKRCSSYDTDGWIRVIEKPHQFWGWTRHFRVVRHSGNIWQGKMNTDSNSTECE